jgi:hypothetical protein
MRLLLILVLALAAVASRAAAAEGRVLKVLPEFLDTNGQYTVSPSLYDRDAYQSYLRLHPAARSALRFAVEWKAKGAGNDPLKLRVELRGIIEGNLPRQKVLEQTVHRHGWFGQWDVITLGGAEYRQFGEVTAWRTTLWDGDQLLSEQKSFLW